MSADKTTRTANRDHLDVLEKGVERWNAWRKENPDVTPDLWGADLCKAELNAAYLIAANLSKANLNEAFLLFADLSQANLADADLRGAQLIGCKLEEAIFTNASLDGAMFMKADLRRVNLSGFSLDGHFLSGTDLSEANLSGASLVGADLQGATLRKCDLSMADLTDANLSEASLVGSSLKGANLTGCSVYGLSAWDIQLEGAIQSDMIITPADVPTITVDNLEVAQFIYLLLNNQKIRDVIDTITSKVVLILGRFTPGRKTVLNAIRAELRNLNYLPVMFDFAVPSNKTTLETVSTLAHMARFVIADITDAKCVLQELQAIVPLNPCLPIQPIILESQTEPGMLDFFKHFPWFLTLYQYEDQDRLLAAITEKVIGPAEARAREQTGG